MLRARPFLCGVLLLLPVAVHAQNKNGPPPDAQSATPDDYAYLNQQKELRGILVTRAEASADGKTKRSLLLRYDYEMMDKNPKYNPSVPPKPHDFTKEFQALQTKINQANQIPNAQKRMMALQNLAVEQQKLMLRVIDEQNKYFKAEADARDRDIKNGNVPYIKVAKAKEFLLEIENDAVIRRMKPVIEYDDKGFRKGEPEGTGFVGYSKEELDKLHLVDNADGKKPGLPAKYDDLRPKQTITLTLKPGKKETKKPAAKTDKTDKSDADDEPFIPLRPSVRMVVIVDDIASPNGSDGPDLPPLKKKKKKKD